MSDRNLSSHFSSQQRQLAASCSGDVLAPQGLPACFLLKPRLCACGRRRQRSVCSAVFALQAIPCSLPSVHSQTHTQKLCEACPELHVRWSSWWVTCWVLALRPREGTGCTASLRLVPIPPQKPVFRDELLPHKTSAAQPAVPRCGPLSLQARWEGPFPWPGALSRSAPYRADQAWRALGLFWNRRHGVGAVCGTGCFLLLGGWLKQSFWSSMDSLLRY